MTQYAYLERPLARRGGAAAYRGSQTDGADWHADLTRPQGDPRLARIVKDTERNALRGARAFVMDNQDVLAVAGADEALRGSPFFLFPQLLPSGRPNAHLTGFQMGVQYLDGESRPREKDSVFVDGGNRAHRFWTEEDRAMLLGPTPAGQGTWSHLVGELDPMQARWLLGHPDHPVESIESARGQTPAINARPMADPEPAPYYSDELEGAA